MVFTKLSVQEKDAFFGLLDEYFQSRPELFGQGGGQGVNAAGGLAGTGISTTAAASVVQRALAANATGSSAGAGSTSSKSNNPYAAAISARSNNADAMAAQAVTVGRVAAASLAFSQATGGPSTPSSSVPSLPRRATSNVPASASAAGDGTPGLEVDKLVTRKASVFNAFKKPASAGVAIPSAFVAPKSTFGPPPMRHAMSETSTSTGSGTGAGSGAMMRAGGAPRAPPRQVPEEEAAEGEWAEVLYDYSSEDPGDLAIEAGTRVFITAKSSEDWWSGQVEGQGKEGLFPASYVKPL